MPAIALPSIDPLIAVRGIHFAASLLAAGTVCVMVLVLEPAARAFGKSAHAAGPALDPDLRRPLTTVFWAALGLSVLSGLAWLALVSANILDASLTDVWLKGGLWEVASGTRFGAVMGLRLAVAGLMGALTLRPAAGPLDLAAAAAWIGLIALTGHAGATTGIPGAVHLVSDIAHLLAAGAWLGGLPAFVLTLLWARSGTGADRRAVTVAATARFSILGIFSVGVLTASGLANSWALLSGPGDLLTTVYGQLLSLKLGLFAAMLALAAVNRYRLTPRLPSVGALGALTRNSLAEIGIGTCIVMLVGALGTIAPGGHLHSNSADVPPDAAFVHIHTEAAMADVTIDPGRAGKAQAHIRLSREDFTELSAKYVAIALDPGSQGQITLQREALRAADGTWNAEFDIPQAGVWTVRVMVTVGTDAPIILDGPIVIMQCSNEC